MKTIIIVGNAPLDRNIGHRIDDHDIVVRFNKCGTMDANGGTKLDILCFTVGHPEHSYILSDDFADKAVRASEHWITHVGKDYQNAEVVTRFNRKFQSSLCPIVLLNDSKDGFHSSGFLAVRYVLNSPRFRDMEKFVAGFEWAGWEGHPWAAERSIVGEAINRGYLGVIS